MPTTDLLAPASGSANVPLNAWIWVGSVEDSKNGDGFLVEDGLGPADIQLSGPAGPVSGTTGTLSTDFDPEGAELTFFRPAADLAPMTTFTFTVNGARTVTFTTGSAEAGASPTVPTVTGEGETFPANECLTKSFGFSFSPGGLFIVAQLQGEESEFSPPPFSGRVARVMSSAPLVESQDGLVFTQGQCANWSVNSSQVRFGAVDIAGQFSGWSAWQPVK
jgi:hypothetical protein